VTSCLAPLWFEWYAQATPAPRWLAGKVYRARITRRWKEPPPGPEAPTDAELDNAVVLAAQGKGEVPKQVLDRAKTADVGQLMTSPSVAPSRCVGGGGWGEGGLPCFAAA
jgi:hypothetical protein